MSTTFQCQIKNLKSFDLQTNRMTSWIDASFVCSTNEAWVNAMRTFVNGSLKMEGDPIFGMPRRNTDRVPLANHPAPHVLRMLDPERMYCKLTNFLVFQRLQWLMDVIQAKIVISKKVLTTGL